MAMFYQHPQFQFAYKRPWPIRKEWLRRNGFFKRLARYGAGGLFIASLAVINILLLRGASATFAFNATNNLGQDHGTHTTANYSDYFENDTPAGNHVGYNSNSDVTVDTVRHRMFVADTSNMRVMVYNLDSSNHFTSTAADYAIGQPDFANSNLPYTTSDCFFGPVVAAQNNLCQPGTLAFDSTNNRLFVADSHWNRVLVFDLAGGISNNMNASYVLGQPNFTSSSCPGTPTQSNLCSVNGLNYDSANQRLFVSDTNRSRVMVYDLSGGLSNGMNAAHVLGQADFTTGTGDVTQNGLNRPTALTYDSTNSRLFVGDDSNQRVMVFNLGSGITDGMNASNVLGQTDFTSSGCASPITQSSICDAGGIAYDSINSRLSISDSFKYRVLTYNLSGGITDGMNAAYEFGQTDFVTFSGHGTTQNSVSLPGGLAYVGQELLVSDTSSSRLLTFDMSGAITNNMNASHEEGQADYLGNPNYTFGSADNANPSPYGFWNGVNGMAEDTVHHRLYVGDFDNNRVLVYDLDANNHLTNRAADHVLGVANFTTVTTQSSGAGCANSTTTCQPIALAADSSGNRLFVANYFDSRVEVFDFSGGISNGMAATRVLGQPNFTTVGEHCSPTTAQNKLCDPAGLAYDSNHKVLYVSEEGNSRVMSFNADPSTMTNGENALHELGQTNFTASACDGGGVTDHTMCSPEGIYYDNADNWLFVTEDDNNRVLQFDLSGTITDGMSAAHVLGQANFTSSACNNGGRNAGRVCNPFGSVVYDPVSKRLFLPDTGNARVLEFNLAGGISNGMNAFSVYGVSDYQNFSAKGPGCNITTAYSMCDPQDLIYDQTSGKLYVPTVVDNRILVFNAGLAITTTSLPDELTGNSYSQTISVTDSSGSTSFSVSNGALPPGLVLNSSTGAITGTPTTTGAYNFTIQATDSLSEIATQDYTVNIGRNYLASDLLGQVDGGGNPIWTNGNNDNSSGSVNSQGFNLPFGTTMDTVHHRLFVAEYGNSRVLVFNLDANNNLVDRTADNVLGWPDFTSGGGFTNCNFMGGTPSASNMCQPAGIAYDPNHDRLFVTDQSYFRVLVFDFSGGISNGMAASYVLGQPDFSTTDCNTTQNGMCGPQGGVIYDSTTNNLYVGDSGNGRVLVYDLSGSISNGMNATYELGQPDFTTANFDPPTQSNVDPEGMAIDTINHRLFVVDLDYAGRVMVFDTSALANGMNATHELGETDFTSYDSAADNGDPPDAKSFRPFGLAYDQNHQTLFVEDNGASRIMLFDVSSIVDGEDAVGVLGQPSLTADNGCGTSQGELCFPEGADDYYDSAHNRLYVSDSGNERIMIYNFNKLVTPASGGSIGSAYSFNTNSQTQGTTAYNLASGALPNGLSLDSSTGLISGTPTTSGLFNFAIHTSDDNGPPGTFVDDANYSINVPSGGDSTSPSVPTGLQVTGHTSSTISLSWTASTDNVGVTGYHVFRDGVQVGAPAGTTFTDTGLASSTTYNYTVSAFDAASNESAQSSPAVPGTTDAPPDNTPPSTPTGLQVTGTTTSTITLSWNPSTDNVGIANYNIFRDGGVTPIAVVGGTGFTDTGLNPSTTYSYTVSAVDTSNNQSPQSIPVQGTTNANSNNGGGGNNGGGNSQGGGGNSQGGSGGGGKKGGTSTTPPGAPTISLDNLPPVSSGSVCKDVSESSAGQLYTFTAADGSNHKVTILQVGADSIEVQIDSLPKTLHVGDLISQDVNGDGVPDVCLDVVSITNGKVELKIDRIIFAIAPGGSTTNNGFGAGSGNSNNTPVVKAEPSFLATLLHHIPKAILLAFPWLLFILLGSSVVRLTYLSFQERRSAGKLMAELAKEKSLNEQRNNFISLTSHYLRTPVASIGTGIELAASLSPDLQAKEELKALSGILNSGVNNLLAQAEHKAPSEMATPAAGEVVSSSGSVITGSAASAPSPLAGFIRIDSLQTIVLAMFAAFGLVGLADYILSHVDLYNVGLIHILTQLAALLLLAVMLIASLRSYRKRRDLRLQTEKVLASHRELDTARVTLIKNSLDGMKNPLKDLKSRLVSASSVPGANQAAMKPALDGVAQLEGLLSKFIIATSLTGGTMARAGQKINSFDLVNDTVKRYSSAIQAKQLKIDNRMFPAEVVQDPLLMSFVVDSLLNNAIKYSPASGQIAIEGKKQGSKIEISVKDNGPGIPVAKQAELFEPFSRVENAVTDFNVQGAGLSLYLDKLVMDYLGGEISLQSSGTGTKVSFSLPA